MKIKFYRVGDEFGFMSNFAPYSFVLDEKKWPTSEHYFQAMKFEDLDYSEKIRNVSSPMQATKLGRNRSFPLRKDWEKIKELVMEKAVYEKFHQNEDIKNMLLDTGQTELVEHTDNDLYWADGGDGSGLNRLGAILMKVRERLL